MLAFEVVVSHMQNILSISPAFFGADNDKTFGHFDPAIAAIRTGRLSHMEWY